tara:strand:+ start:923 stop:1102 length:180 start_codon:yes stop_codon:yes gene_type:complete
MAQYNPQCFFCKQYLDKLTCKAYAEGIPEKIYTNTHDHTKPFKGDNGIQFEPIEETNDR